jgi:predicted small metal-binding protein
LKGWHKEVETMKGELKQISCDPECGFLIRSHDEKEILGTAKTHVKNVHHMKVTDADLRERMTAA